MPPLSLIENNRAKFFFGGGIKKFGPLFNWVRDY